MTYNLNLIPGKVPVAVHVKQYDTGLREITFNLYYGDTAYSVPYNSTITVSGTKPDGNGFSYNVTQFSGSAVTIPMQEQMTVLAGEFPCQLTIANSGEIIGTASFLLCVEPAALSSDTPVSDTDLAMFQQLANQTQTEAAGVANATAQIAANTAAITELNGKNYTNVTAAQTLLAYISSLSNGSYFVYSSTLTGGPHTSCYYRIYKHSTYAYVVATRAASDKLTYDAYITPSTSAIAWTKIPTRAEIDTLNSKTASIEARFGSFLPTNTNIDNLSVDDGGMWLYERVAPGNHTGTFPQTDTYGWLINIPGTSANFCTQIIRSNSLAASSGMIYIRFRVSGAWGNWMKIVATAI